LRFEPKVLNRIDVENDPVNFVDPWGLDSVTVYSGGSFHLGASGVSFQGGIAADTKGKICIVSKICGTAGPGVYADLGLEIEGDSADLCEGQSDSEGAFVKGGDGIVGGGCVTGNSSGHSTDAGFGGVGGGAAAGYITCRKTTICFN
jgi:hypothetical protein